jgi:uncharacterized membrane protein YbaN (DUF454 family)
MVESHGSVYRRAHSQRLSRFTLQPSMRRIVQNQILVILGWFFVLLGTVGAVLPILPTTPFLILALALFSKSSPRFHKMLLENPWFGPTLRQWEETKSIQRKTKRKVLLLIALVFAISIAFCHGKVYLQLTLVALAAILMLIIWRLRETP